MKFNLGKKALLLVAMTTLSVGITACSSTTPEQTLQIPVETPVPIEDSVVEEDNLEVKVIIDEVNGVMLTIPSNFTFEDRNDETGMKLTISSPQGDSLHVVTIANATQRDANINRQSTIDILEIETEAFDLVEHESELVIIDDIEFNLIVTEYSYNLESEHNHDEESEHNHDLHSRVQSYYYYLDEENNIFYNFIVSIHQEDIEAQEKFNEIINSITINR